MGFSSAVAAEAAFALGPLAFRCLACGARHKWDPRHGVSKVIQSCLDSVNLASGMLVSDRRSLVRRRHLFMPYFSMPVPSFWIDTRDESYLTERQALLDDICEVLEARLARVDDADMAIFTAYTHSVSQCESNERRLSITSRPSFLSLTPEAARHQVLQHVCQVYGRMSENNLVLVEEVAPHEVVSRYKAFVERYCARLLPDESMWLVHPHYAGPLNTGARVVSFSDCPGFVRAVDRCFSIVRTAGERSSSCFRQPRNATYVQALRCSPDGAFAVCEQEGPLMRVWHTDDYVTWDCHIRNLPELPLAYLEGMFAELRNAL